MGSAARTGLWRSRGHALITVDNNVLVRHSVHELLTADRDFSRFPELKVRNPLI